ncbi:MAG: protease modulator HflC, partial [Acidobacteria bacterium]|nr:protease modulator HflC [Candidatus Sulfomarinibacter kjeldsenii]
MKQLSILIVLVIVLLVVAALGGAFFVVNEAQQVIITQFGRPVGEPVMTPGLKIKMPFIQTANFF